jgi:hypothetical protein
MNNKIEIWKDIPGYEDYYQVSNWGNVKSPKRMIVRKKRVCQLTRSVFLKPFRGKTAPYFQVQLCKNGIEHKFLIHRLAAQAFLPDWDSRLEVNHIDGNKHNNRSENLHMCTRQENIDHSIANHLKRDYGENHVHARFTNAEVTKIRNLHIWGIRQTDLAKMYKVSKQTICDIIHNKSYIQ